MADEEALSEWGERWLREWIEEAGADTQERENREWLAGHKRSVTLDIVVRDWWHQHRGLDDHFTKTHVNNDLRLYVHERHALPVWRAFLYLRSEAQPIPEVILAKFEQWGRRLVELSHRSESGSLSLDSELALFASALGPLAADDDTATLQALELTGTRKRHVSFKRLREAEARRRVATEIDHLRRAGWLWKRIAERVGLNEPAAKDRYYEFVPSKRKRLPAMDAQPLSTAMRRMVRGK